VNGIIQLWSLTGEQASIPSAFSLYPDLCRRRKALEVVSYLENKSTTGLK